MTANANESDAHKSGERGRLPPLITSGPKWVAAAVRPRVVLGPLQTTSAAVSPPPSEERSSVESEVVQDASAKLDGAAVTDVERSVEETASDVTLEPELEATFDAHFESLTEVAGWEEEKLPSSFGEPQAGDEQSLTAGTGFVAPPEEGWSAQSEPLEAEAPMRGFTADPELAAEFADRLERIARTLRQQGAMAALAQHADDPLGAMVTGYLLGFSESVRRAPFPADSGVGDEGGSD
ncbi:MAG: hypothetical protein GEU90_04915 [Gemmatimonas sp.]|nr:hypothetical protein [Gemmatimonas sp.]